MGQLAVSQRLGLKRGRKKKKKKEYMTIGAEFSKTL